MTKYTVDIDTGGTFTDGFFTAGNRYEVVKVDTTPHDLTVCFNNCIAEGAKRFGFADVRSFLKETKTIRLSTTVGTNSIIQRSGPKLGLIVTAGEEETLYQSNNPLLHFLLQPEMVVGIEESVSKTGQLLREVDEEAVRIATKRLLKSGARMIVVSLSNAHLNLHNERKIREIIQQDFPKHYLGAKSILLASEISLQEDDGIRTNAAIVNAYLHRDMVRYLYKADEDVRVKGFTNPLLIAHSNGGVARVAKTKAIDTYNSGPAAGLMGSKYIGDLYGLDHIITVDVGGTSTDVGLVSNGELNFDTASKIAGVPVHTPLIHVLSVGGGGGSVAKVTKDDGVQVGPESAGAVPGPACFDLGGMKPTVTDAAVVLGLVDPHYFLGGAKKLNREKARDVIHRAIATPLNISIEQAARMIINQLEQIGAGTLQELCAERGKTVGNFVLFSFGGGGGLFSAGMAKKGGIKQIYTFPYSSVFSAFGLSTADITHNYQKRTNLKISKNQAETDLEVIGQEIAELCAKMKTSAYRDMRGEGFSSESVSLQLSLQAASANRESLTTISLDLEEIENRDFGKLKQRVHEICNQFKSDDAVIEFIQLGSVVKVAHYDLVSNPLDDKDPKHAVKGIRNVFWEHQFRETSIYDLEKIRPGNEISGPAVIESVNTTIAVPESGVFRMNEYNIGVMEV
jgi:N-methylhydantoinase A